MGQPGSPKRRPVFVHRRTTKTELSDTKSMMDASLLPATLLLDKGFAYACPENHNVKRSVRPAKRLSLERPRQPLRHVLAQANCLVWHGIIYEIFAEPGYEILFDAERGTRLHWEIAVVNRCASEVPSWLPLARDREQTIMEAWRNARHPEDSVLAEQHGNQSIRSGKDRYTHTFRNIMADGSIRWTLEDVSVKALSSVLDPVQQGAAYATPNRDGLPLRRWRLTGVVTDVTERKVAEERQEQLTEELRRSNATLQEFVYVASHDLKEPLRKIQAFGNLLLSRTKGNLPSDIQNYIERMVSAAGRMQTLLQALLDYSRATGKGTGCRTVDLNTTLANVLTDLEEHITATHAVIQADKLPVLLADPVQMAQLFQNLLVNALKYRRSGVSPRILLSVQERPHQYAISIRDNGIGFSATDTDRIFQMFERLDEKNGVSGNGIGLAICKKIVEQHGGTIAAEGHPGIGATFTVTLPRSAPPLFPS